MGIFNINKKLTVYALVSKQIKNRFLTISDDKTDVYEYAMLLLKLQHQDHFESWCQLRQIEKPDLNAWLRYYATSIDAEEKEDLQVIKVSYHKKDVIAMLRMFGNCFPIGCSFDTELERRYYDNLVKEKNIIEQKTSQVEEEQLAKEDNSNGA